MDQVRRFDYRQEDSPNHKFRLATDLVYRLVCFSLNNRTRPCVSSVTLGTIWVIWFVYPPEDLASAYA